jgi:hypothetical protein
MTLINACKEILLQLADLVNDLKQEDFCRPSNALSGSTVGQHLRHTLEFFICFQQGTNSGVINYDKRNHDKAIESDRYVALNAIQNIIEFVTTLDYNKSLMLEVNYEHDKDIFHKLETTSQRELVYNIEHAVHHMAIMKIGVREVAPYIQLPRDFGIAASTLRYQQMNFSVAQA